MNMKIEHDRQHVVSTTKLNEKIEEIPPKLVTKDITPVDRNDKTEKPLDITINNDQKIILISSDNKKNHC